MSTLCSIEPEAETSPVKSVPIYMKRQGFRPRKPEDFGDGGAFPEIHVFQRPLGMGSDGSNKPDSKILPVTVDLHGNVVFDAIVRQGENLGKIVYSQHSDIIPKVLKTKGDVYDVDVDDDDDDEDEELKKETTEITKTAIEKIVNASQVKDVVKRVGDSKYIKYKPSQKSSAAFNSGAKERIVKVSEMPVDPLDIPKFRHKRVPVAAGSGDPVPVMHSPPRDVTVKDLQDWRSPPCVSGWKNRKGYTIPLDERCAADGRVLQEAHINDKFAMLSESLDIGEQKAREAVSMRLKVQKEMMMKEKERKEQELKDLALKARSERSVAASEGVNVSKGKYDYGRKMETELEQKERMQREQIREERHRERRMLDAKKNKITRDRDRDVGEKVALGMAFTGGRGGEVMYDQRLFNQEKGMNSGFATDDQYNIYDKGLFTAQPTLLTLYRPKKDMDDEMYVNANEQLDKLKNTERFKPDKTFSGLVSERAGKRHRPVEFEKECQEQDLFGLKQWESDLKKGKMLSEKAEAGGTMRGHCSSRDEYGGGSGQIKIIFKRGS